MARKSLRRIVVDAVLGDWNIENRSPEASTIVRWLMPVAREALARSRPEAHLSLSPANQPSTDGAVR